MPEESPVAATRTPKPEWYAGLVAYRRPHLPKAAWQLASTFILYFGLWAVMIWLSRRGVSYWVTLPAAVLAGGLLVRIFIFFHDCCHGSFFASRRANRILGNVAGVLTFTPFNAWRALHMRHHAATAGLDQRGPGDIWMYTVAEYRATPRWKRLAYRLYRHPFVMFGLGPTALLLIGQRFPHRSADRRERLSVHLTSLAVLAVAMVASLAIGWRTYLSIQLPIVVVAGGVGVWLFYIQHQFEDVVWSRKEDWDSMTASLSGSSYYKLPRLLQWFTGNIGLHHIHHVRPSIPNYNLQKCLRQTPALQAVRPLTLRRSLKSLWMNLWDEEQRKLVSFRAAARSG